MVGHIWSAARRCLYLTLHKSLTNIYVPWKGGRTLAWDATCPGAFAPSHVALAAREAGTVGSQAESKKLQKNAFLGNGYHFVPITIETSRVLGPEALSFLRELGR